jgi:hypothetical protein
VKRTARQIAVELGDCVTARDRIEILVLERHGSFGFNA